MALPAPLQHGQLMVVEGPVRNGDRSRVQSPKSVAFDLSYWHSGPACQRSFVPGVGGIGVKICCAPCGVLCDVEALGNRITVEDSCHARTPRESDGG